MNRAQVVIWGGIVVEIHRISCVRAYERTKDERLLGQSTTETHRDCHVPTLNAFLSLHFSISHALLRHIAPQTRLQSLLLEPRLFQFFLSRLQLRVLCAALRRLLSGGYRAMVYQGSTGFGILVSLHCRRSNIDVIFQRHLSLPDSTSGARMTSYAKYRIPGAFVLVT